MLVPTAAKKKTQKQVSRVKNRIGYPPKTAWPYAAPLAPRFHEARWALKLRTTPVTTPEEFVARVGMTDIEEMVSCQCCGARRFQPLFNPVRPGRWVYHVVRCAECSFLFRQPGIKPERLGELYGKGNYGDFLVGHYGKKRKRRYRMMMNRFKPFFADGSGRRLLDYGCGAGLFLDVAEERGFEPYGVDLSEDAVEVARTKPSGAHAHFGSPLEVPEIAAGGFDVVTLWSVLAHLPRPVEDLTMLRGLLNDQGAMLILTVNANSLHLKARGDKWNGFTPNHLIFSSPTTQRLMLKQAGFGALVMPPHYGDAFERGKMKMAPSYAQRLKRSIDRTNQGNMLRTLAFVDPDGPARWGITEHVTRL